MRARDEDDNSAAVNYVLIPSNGIRMFLIGSQNYYNNPFVRIYLIQPGVYLSLLLHCLFLYDGETCQQKRLLYTLRKKKNNRRKTHDKRTRPNQSSSCGHHRVSRRIMNVVIYRMTGYRDKSIIVIYFPSVTDIGRCRIR